MVGMFMGDENVMDFRQGYLHILQDTEEYRFRRLYLP